MLRQLDTDYTFSYYVALCRLVGYARLLRTRHDLCVDSKEVVENDKHLRKGELHHDLSSPRVPAEEYLLRHQRLVGQRQDGESSRQPPERHVLPHAVAHRELQEGPIVLVVGYSAHDGRTMASGATC